MNIRDELTKVIASERVFDRYIDRIAYASDASFYRLIPQAVVQPSSLSEIQALFRFSHTQEIPLTFRAGGTSLSGQAISDGILVDISRHWGNYQVESEGALLRAQPGVRGARLNAVLKPYRRKIGPDPASINMCTLGGILANNSGGMACGVEHNSYHTLANMIFLLPDGTLLDSSQANVDALFKKSSPSIFQGLLQIKSEIESKPELVEKIQRKYAWKNTSGYSLNAFLDFSSPTEIMTHLLIGSEGTLGFIGEATLKTIPNDYNYFYTGLLIWEDVSLACHSIDELSQTGALSIELMDQAALAAVAGQRGMPKEIENLPPSSAALLVEYATQEKEQLEELKEKIRDFCQAQTLYHPPIFTESPEKRAQLWQVRKGLFPSVGSVREPGTSVIIEDIAVATSRLGDVVGELQELFRRYEYKGIIFGHAKDGNVHFVLAPSFNNEKSIQQYQCFTEELVTLVVDRYDGALKAEHGTGRNMAPFIEREWNEGYPFMVALKKLLDPSNLLNPGVIINPDPLAHVKNLKSLPLVDEEVDRCIECGFCETSCPSRNLTLTPRQRIVVKREMARLEKEPARQAEWQSLKKDFFYAGLETCATDGLCALSCPVKIDTGKLVKKLREQEHGFMAHFLAGLVAKYFSQTENLIRLTLFLGHQVERWIGFRAIEKISTWGNALNSHFPLWRKLMPQAYWPPKVKQSKVKQNKANKSKVNNSEANQAKETPPDALYFSSCLSRVMRPSREILPSESISLEEVWQRLGKRANIKIQISQEKGICCAMPFLSKGFFLPYQKMINRTIAHFWRLSQEGKFPIIMDTTSCTFTLKNCFKDLTKENQRKYRALKIYDSIEFVYDILLPKLKATQKEGRVVLHPVCSATKLGLIDKFVGVAKFCSEEVFLPNSSGCCGFAGDRGFLVPELNKSATQEEAAEVGQKNYDGYYSSSQTCELGMSLATGKAYQSYLYLLEKATRDSLSERNHEKNN